ncbi:M14 metallopeptidase family protein [Rufibacter sp. LB8]|uniref:M14 family metallopeptidase n=2 Tax=Rufibacter sp. LB8 TaxID=2777781 RepID=UPI001CEF97F8|nr:M14 metallopeptidase family protein [Rufibacter sp. LB8]
MRKLLLYIFLFMTLPAAQCQTVAPAQVAKLAFDEHVNHKEPTLQHRRFKHKDVVPLLRNLAKEPRFEVKVAGKSVENRDIYLVKIGTGQTKVLLWSQMHGDEATATMALFDLFKLLQNPGKLEGTVQEILQNLTLYFVPMLNPDGAEVFTRRNALGLDLNRDALRLQSPEARLLKNLQQSLKPEFGFNLHDQSRYYTVGATAKPATISFLAPAFDFAQTVNPVRDRAMRTIVGMNEGLQQLIPGHVAKYSDEHEPRAFGDNIQKWGTSVILIESGGYQNDPEKQVIRQLNFATILSALHLIGNKGYEKYKLEDYFKIPQNERNLFDLVIRNVRYQDKNRDTLMDIGINRDELSAQLPDGFYRRSSVEEIGDMRVFYGYEELDGQGLTMHPGNVFPTPLKDVSELTWERAQTLLAEGYTTVKITNRLANLNPTLLPLNLLAANQTANHSLALEKQANFILKDASGAVKYAIVNGFVYKLGEPKPAVFHGAVL